MSKTLREIYIEKQYKILTEALDPDKLQQMAQNIATITNIISPAKGKLPNLVQALDAARDMAGKNLGGGGKWKQIATNINDKFGIVDDMKKFITMQASILQGIRSMPKVLALLKKSNVNQEDTLNTLENVFKEDPNSANEIVKVLAKAFSPPGGIFRNKKLPFGDATAIAQDFLKLSIDEIFQIANKAGQAPQMPISGQETAQIMQSSNQDAAKQMAAGAPQQATGADVGKDAAGGSSDVAPSSPGASSSVPPAQQTGQKQGTRGQKAQPGAAPVAGGGGRLPDFQTAMAAVGAKNLNDPANKKTVDTFKRFYDYLIKNAK